MHAQPWAYGAGGRKEAGRVLAPRHAYRRGPQDISHGGPERNADGVQWPEGSSPGGAMASAQDTTGVSERGMSAEGERGNVGEPPVSWSQSRHGGPGDQQPGRGRGASTRPRARQGDHARRDAGTVAGRERQAQCRERGSVAV